MKFSRQIIPASIALCFLAQPAFANDKGPAQQAISDIASNQSVPLNTADEIVDLAQNVAYTVHIDRINQNVVVYRSPATNKIYMQPYLIVDSPNLKKQYNTVCANIDGAALDKTRAFSVRFHTSEKEVLQDVLNAVNAREKHISAAGSYQPNIYHSINSWPYRYLTLSAIGYESKESSKTVVYPMGTFPQVSSDSELGQGGVIHHFPGRQFTKSRLSVSCHELSGILANDKFQLKIFSDTQLTTNARREAVINYSLSSKEIADVLRGEGQTGTIKAENKFIADNGSISFSIDSLFIGKQKRKNTATASLTDNRARYVNSHAIRTAAQRSTLSISMETWQDIKAGSGIAWDDKMITDFVTKRILNNADKVVTRIEDNRLLINGLERSLSDAELISLQSTGQNLGDNKASSETSTTTPDGQDVTSKASYDEKYTDGRGITYEQKQGSWVPTSLELYVINEETVSNLIRISDSQYHVVGGRYLQFWPISSIDQPPLWNSADMTMDGFAERFTTQMANEMKVLNKKMDVVVGKPIPFLTLTRSQGKTLFGGSKKSKGSDKYANEECAKYKSFGYTKVKEYSIDKARGDFGRNGNDPYFFVSGITCH
ncbi:hypothetical protein LRP52_35885 [Photobacterium sp. ZSDE20]|uniref:Uncharacterized protein n=1 Tax=Photobacterium pectinilyticum TaxID=2906793 RepID=A0ABT1N5U1_9GAMM|nr:hypothetical protein [Photobacterium sp. ZSDE20]MCQ1060110.1 hypothetical protein [Photobacterium sp. ZSDE20]MDD1827566.1 hypothetical protein [Photobacterium sp. ZSDE20]